MSKRTSPQTFGSILRRVVSPQRGGLGKAAAREILEMQFPKSDLRRMEELLKKGSEGGLSAQEDGELESYRNVGVFMSLLQSRARQSLKKTIRVVR